MNIELTEDHRYINDAGVEFPGVTGTIGDAGYMGWLPRDQYYLDRGTAVHLATELDDQGVLDESSVDPVVAPFLDAWRAYRRDTHREFLFFEKQLYHPTFGYCGTLDRDGLDIKTGCEYKWHKVQAAAYLQLMLVNGYPLPDKWISVYLKQDGKYNTRPYDILTLLREFQAFTSALVTANWKRENKIT